MIDTRGNRLYFASKVCQQKNPMVLHDDRGAPSIRDRVGSVVSSQLGISLSLVNDISTVIPEKAAANEENNQ